MNHQPSTANGRQPQQGVGESLRCPICGGVPARHKYKPLLQCGGCGLLCTDPAYITPPDLMYDEGYYSERTPYLQNSAFFLDMFGQLFDRIGRYKQSGRVLDVGCGVGQLLQVAQARGYTAEGCDFSPWATEYARQAGYTVRTGSLETLGYAERSFDIVIASHTLEHIPAPVPFLQAMRRVLKDDGLLVIAVPNIASVMAFAMRERWAGLKPEQHLWHFTPHTVRSLLSRAGLRTVRVSSDPYLHHHPNAVKNAVLVAVSAFGSLIGRSDYMTAYAVKEQV